MRIIAARFIEPDGSHESCSPWSTGSCGDVIPDGSPSSHSIRVKIPPFDRLRVVSEVELPKAGVDDNIHPRAEG